MADVSPNILYTLGKNEQANTRISTISRLCVALNISLADFFCCDTFRDIESIKK